MISKTKSYHLDAICTYMHIHTKQCAYLELDSSDLAMIHFSHSHSDIRCDDFRKYTISTIDNITIKAMLNTTMSHIHVFIWNQKTGGNGGGIGRRTLIAAPAPTYGPGLLDTTSFRERICPTRKYGSEHMDRQPRTSKCFNRLQLTAM